MYYKAHEMVKNVGRHKNGGYNNILDRWNNDDKYRKSLPDIGWAEECIIQHEEIALTDPSFVGTGSRNEKSWNLSLKTEGTQGPLNQRSDFQEAKQTCKRLYHEYTAITGSGKLTYPCTATTQTKA